ncbi:MAG: REC domain-containing diguanylate cyclase, partial [Betaproteobacteria bacterium]|nr:REC domain-containing diguanylate cyclase [Betaproteobacteria bacterium]
MPDPVASDSPLQLLVVDDDDLDRERVRRMLAQITLRCAVTEVDSVTAAKAELGHHEFDCIFLDYHLGDAIGTELIDAIGSIVKCPPPIVMITGAGDERTAVSALQQGVYDYIPKRLLRSDLLETVLTSSLQRARLEKEIRTQQERLEYLSLYDSLTGLPNRSLFFDRLNRELKIALRTGRPFAVLQIDLNLFKEINDRYGHAAGDAVLTEVAQRFKSALRDIDTVARLGGDEFAAILTDVGTPESAITAASKLQQVLTEPIMVEDTVTQNCDLVRVGAAIGIALCPLHANTADALLVKADHAMYRAKKTGECVVFDEGMVADID